WSSTSYRCLHSFPTRRSSDLQAADVFEALEVTRLRPFRVLVAEPEVAHVLVLVLDREHDEHRHRQVRSRQLDHSRHEVDALEHRSEEHTSELQSLAYLVCRLL